MNLTIKEAGIIARFIRQRLMTGREIFTEEENIFLLSTPVRFYFEPQKIEETSWNFEIARKYFTVQYNPKIASYEVFERFKESKSCILRITGEIVKEKEELNGNIG